MILTLRQPCFAPWLGFFHELKKSDVHVFLDDVQYGKNSWNNRNKIRSGPGEEGWSWLTVPVLTKYKSKQLLNEAKIDYTKNWREKHLRTLRYHYAKAPFYEEVMTYLDDLFSKVGDNSFWQFSYLNILNRAFILDMSDKLDIGCQFITSSQLEKKGKKLDLVIDICKKTGADKYITGVLGKDYIDEQRFKDEGIELIWNEYKSPEYSQVYEPFIPNLSVIDAWANLGLEGIKELI